MLRINFILPVYQPIFTGKSILKREFLKGHIPIKYDITGNRLTPKNLTVDHTIPKSKGGKSELANYSLMCKWVNNLRGNDNIREFIDLDSLLEYIEVMLNVKTDKFDGVEYLRIWLKNLLRELKRS